MRFFRLGTPLRFGVSTQMSTDVGTPGVPTRQWYPVGRRQGNAAGAGGQDHPTLRHRRAQAETAAVPGLRTCGIVGLTRRRPVGKTVPPPRIGGGPSRAVSVGCPWAGGARQIRAMTAPGHGQVGDFRAVLGVVTSRTGLSGALAPWHASGTSHAGYSRRRRLTFIDAHPGPGGWSRPVRNGGVHAAVTAPTPAGGADSRKVRRGGGAATRRGDAGEDGRARVSTARRPRHDPHSISTKEPSPCSSAIASGRSTPS